MKKKHSNLVSLVAICLGFFMVIIDITVVNVALPSISRDLGGEISTLQWIVDGYALSFACLLLLVGNLADKYGAKRLFMMGLLLFTISSLGCALSSTPLSIILFRIIQGIGGALIIPTSLSLINSTFDNPKEKAKAIGIWGGIGGIAATLGPILGALLTAGFSWRAVFFINIPVGVLATYLCLNYVKTVLGNKTIGIDLLGQIFSILWIGSLAFALIEVGRLGWTSPIVLISIAVFLLGLIFFIIIESSVSSPMFPLSVLSIKNFSIPLLLGIFINISTYGLLFLLPLYFQEIKQYSVLITGFAIVPLFILVALSSYLSGKAVTLLGIKPVIDSGLVIGVFGFLGMLWVINLTHPDYIWMIIPLACIGFGISFTMPAATIVIIRSVEHNRAGFASSSFNMARQLGTLIGVATFGTVIVISKSFILGMSISLCIAAAIYILGMLLCIKINEN
ncbi:MFS transporter [Facilibium subflavum]|uniref:MFS transporter n=1 Tax=Facilibium subflavum TaxID=2219058 RepID=UPI000E64B893|nr:MFS transporter [Facilibium subflavum]